jgi:hypothetical protein
MKIRAFIHILAYCILCICFSLMIGTEGIAQIKKGSQVKISLEELKELLHLDTDEISLTWEEFQQLVSQTGEEISFSYTVENGKVILPREQFKQLLENMKPPERSLLKPPTEYIITKAEYQGQMDEQSVTFTVLFYLEVFEKEEAAYRKIPFLPQSVALTNVLLDDKPALVSEEDGWYSITTAESGQHLLKVSYFAPHNLERGPQILNLSIIKTAITLFDLEIPLEDVDIEIPNAKEIDISQDTGKTRINAVLPATNVITVNIFLPKVTLQKRKKNRQKSTPKRSI